MTCVRKAYSTADSCTIRVFFCADTVSFQIGNVDVWTRPILPNGSLAFAFLNFGTGGTPTT